MNSNKRCKLIMFIYIWLHLIYKYLLNLILKYYILLFYLTALYVYIYDKQINWKAKIL